MTGPTDLTGAERYLTDRLAEPEYREHYERAAASADLNALADRLDGLAFRGKTRHVRPDEVDKLRTAARIVRAVAAGGFPDRDRWYGSGWAELNDACDAVGEP